VRDKMTRRATELSRPRAAHVLNGPHPGPGPELDERRRPAAPLLPGGACAMPPRRGACRATAAWRGGVLDAASVPTERLWVSQTRLPRQLEARLAPRGYSSCTGAAGIRIDTRAGTIAGPQDRLGDAGRPPHDGLSDVGCEVGVAGPHSHSGLEHALQPHLPALLQRQRPEASPGCRRWTRPACGAPSGRPKSSAFERSTSRVGSRFSIRGSSTCSPTRWRWLRRRS
jgi:hypothetical protein